MAEHGNSSTRTVLADISATIQYNSPTKRKYLTVTKSHASDAAMRKRRRSSTGQENEYIAKRDCLKIPQAPTILTSRESFAPNPESQDTVVDLDLSPTSSEKKTEQVDATPDRSIASRPVSSSQESARLLATNIKCRLKLAMYKLQSHKEELDYKSLLPRESRALRIGSPTPPASQSTVARKLASQLATPRPITSITSNERSMPSLLHRSSSGNASISETPIRRNYQMGLSSPPDSKETLPQYHDIRLPHIRKDNDRGAAFTLPSLSAISPYAKHTQRGI